jgi:hypothetical protein
VLNYANNLDAFGGDKPYNLDRANTKVYEGDRTQYSYLLNRDAAALNISTELDLKDGTLYYLVSLLIQNHLEMVITETTSM